MGGHGCSPYSSSTMDLGKLGFAEIEEFSGGEVQGRSDGGIWVYIPPKSVQVNFLLVKMTSERLLNSFIPPTQKKLLYSQNKFLATPLVRWGGGHESVKLTVSLYRVCYLINVL